MHASSLWTIARQKAEIRAEPLPPLKENELRVKTLFSGLSRGTERLVFHGLLMTPDREFMRCPHQQGDFPFPVKYGYCAVGEIIAGENKGKNVFCLHPHQDYFQVDANAVTLLPSALPAKRAILAANMETAINAVWDGEVTIGQKIIVVGAGVVGLLIAYLCAQIKGCEVWVIDIDPSKKSIATHLGLNFQKPLDAPDNADVVFHTSASESGLACALSCAGVEAKIIEISWFGDYSPRVPLGAGFHPKRLKLLSSQVGTIAANQRARTTYKSRMALAVAFLQDEKLDALITHTIPFKTLPEKLKNLFNPATPLLAAAIEY